MWVLEDMSGHVVEVGSYGDLLERTRDTIAGWMLPTVYKVAMQSISSGCRTYVPTGHAYCRQRLIEYKAQHDMEGAAAHHMDISRHPWIWGLEMDTDANDGQICFCFQCHIRSRVGEPCTGNDSALFSKLTASL